MVLTSDSREERERSESESAPVLRLAEVVAGWEISCSGSLPLGWSAINTAASGLMGSYRPS